MNLDRYVNISEAAGQALHDLPHDQELLLKQCAIKLDAFAKWLPEVEKFSIEHLENDGKKTAICLTAIMNHSRGEPVAFAHGILSGLTLPTKRESAQRVRILSGVEDQYTHAISFDSLEDLNAALNATKIVGPESRINRKGTAVREL